MGELDDRPAVSTRTAFVVWLGRDATGQFEGIVQRARTSEKHPFRGLEALGPLIGRMTEGDEPQG